MNHFAIAAVFCVVAAFTLNGADAQSTGNLMCYNCTYTTVLGFEVGEKGCDDAFSATGISKISCDGSCAKRVLEGDIPATMRTCHTALEGECVELNRFEISAGNYISQHCCSGNLCNSAGALAFNLLVAVVAVCGALAVKY
ncbi:uncharacterized protein LOC119727694 [Patiria miniata]|uniref:Uncharacterized protein n=1 Tax=Patiria miniata TaxID=46514 RepID=A0A913ZVU6_PATMI|nr:uncharacterized protein LOC119727694 [Patiria miniata]